ncbi:RNA-directed DNA polymerase from mobile element jockey-like [Brachionus plicatilis]|uniref:RNA-directed DNA polymerase from mobile element jockey-like n=1 Tax=Brachionus plicatilis TaxID=10195 RepID=A0A3M7PG38_BRAPC|nr:RNA-directed DNA polymerase from mobile element jockey-like [Brachionus plicatilis]
MLNDESLSQIVTSPTFRKANGNTTNTLDLIITDSRNRLSCLSESSPLGSSEQAHISLSFKIEIANEIKEQFFSNKYAYKRGDFGQMQLELDRKNWGELFENKNIEQCYDEFLNTYNSLCDKFIPKFKQKINKRKPSWINPELAKLIKKKKSLWHQLRASGGKNRSLEQSYTSVKREIEKKSRDSIRLFEKSLADDKLNPKRLYAYVNEKQKVKMRITSITNDSGVSTTNRNEIADTLNKHFSSVFVNEESSRPMKK